jgi:beta-glucosidase
MLDYNIRNGRTYMYFKNIPLFPFGYGLTYTSFNYSELKTDKKTIGKDDIVNVSFTLQNTGNFDGDEVAQLYASFPDSRVERPAKALKGFKRVHIKKGESVNVTIPVKASDLTYWDTNTGKWTFESGKVRLGIGRSSDDILLTGGIDIK